MLYRTSSPVLSLRHEIDRLFEDTLGMSTGRRGWTPAVDVRENEREYTFEIELAGVSPEQVEVTADNGVLTVRGEKSAHVQREQEEGRVHFVERSYGSFVRSFQLPQGVDDSAISAEFDDGLLTVRVPKAARPQPRRIDIGRGAAQVSGGEPRATQVGAGQRTEQRGGQRGESTEPEGDGARGRSGSRRETTATGSR